MTEKNLLAVIPARGGSKRLPRKNLLELGGKPLISWTIESALKSGCFSNVLVSTDDQQISDIARNCGAFVPWLRPQELATDDASSIDVVLHAADWYEREVQCITGIMLLQPTSPFRSVETIRQACEVFFNCNTMDPVVSVSPAINHPAWTFSMVNGNLKPFCDWNGLHLRSQDLLPAYAPKPF